MSDQVKNDVLVRRLNQLSDAVTKGRCGIEREFYMSIPARRDHDADLVLSEAADRITALESALRTCRDHTAGIFGPGHPVTHAIDEVLGAKR